MMTQKIFRCGVFLLSIVFVVTGAGLFTAMGQDHDEMEVVFFNPDSGSQNPVDATNALQTFCNVINKQEGWNLRAYFFKKQKDLDNFLDTRKVDLGILSQVYVVENYKKRNLVPFVIPVREGKTTYRKVIVVQKASGYNDIHDLKGKTLAATALGDENVTFYNKIVFQGEIDVEKHFKEIKIVDSANSAIMAVLYGQVDAASVTLASYAIMQDFNPQVKQKLTSIFASKDTPISPMVFFKDNFDPAKMDKITKLLLNMHNDPIGRQSMLAFQVEAWEPTNLEFFRETEEILLAHAATAAAPSKTPSPAAVPEKSPVATTTDTAATTKPPTPVPTPLVAPKAALDVTRVQIYKSEEGKLVFNAWIAKGDTDIDPAGVMVYYRLDAAAEKTLAMSSVDAEKFSAQIDFAGPATTGDVTEIAYTVKRGDTLGKIANEFLGSTKKYMVIATLNNITDPNLIQVGQKLRVKTGEQKVTEVKYYVTARDKAGKQAKSEVASRFIL